MSPSLRDLERRVCAVVAALRRQTYLAAIPWGVSLAGALLILAWILAGPDGWRPGSDAPLWLDVTAVLLLLGIAGTLWREGVRRLTTLRVARMMEEAAGLPGGSVAGPLEMSASVPVGVSAGLVSHAARRVADALDRAPPETSASAGRRALRWRRRGWAAAVGVWIVVGMLLGSNPSRALASWLALARPMAAWADPILPALAVRPGNLEVRRGSAVRVEVEAGGRESVRLTLDVVGQPRRVLRLRVRGGRAGYSLERVSEPVRYRVDAEEGAVAGPFEILPVDPLIVGDLRVRVLPPEYTGVPASEYRGEVPPLVLPRGTRLVVDGAANHPLSHAVLVHEDGDTALDLGLSEAKFEGSFTPARAGVYAWTFRDADGAAAEIGPDPVDIVLTPDGEPSIAVPLPGRDTVLPLGMRQLLVIEARDDYGLSLLELVAYRVTAFGEREEPRVQRGVLSGARAVLARPLLDVSAWGIMPGDTVRFFARVTDNAPGGGHVVSSREYRLWMPAAAELQREAEKVLDEAAQRLEALSEEARRQAEETRKLERSAAAPPPEASGLAPMRDGEEGEGDFRSREEGRRALERQEEMDRQVDSLRARLEALQRTLEDAGQADTGVRRELQELQRLLEEVAGEGMKEAVARLRESLEKEAGNLPEALRELAGRQERLQDRLEASVERFRRAAVEQDFRATEKEARDLAQGQKALGDALEEEENPERRAERQAEMQERAEALEERLRELQERLKKLDESPAAEAVEGAREENAEAAGRMEEAATQAQAGRKEEAARAAREAAEAMEAAAGKVSEARQQMAEARARAAQEALRRAADDALALARTQTRLRQAMESADRQVLADMRADEAALARGLRNLAAGLLEAEPGALLGNQELSRQMAGALESMQKTVEALGSRRGTAPAPRVPADQAVRDLNRLALMALAAAEEMSRGRGEGSSSPEEVAEQLQDLAQRQGEVNEETSQLMPLELGEEALRRQLEALAREQESVARELDDVSREPGAEEGALGDLDQIMAEARALAGGMAAGRLTPDMMRRQERLFHRLLDAGRSLERDEYADEREAKRPEAVLREGVAPLDAEALGALRLGVPDGAALRRLPPAVRQLVLEYFEALNAGDGRKEGSASGARRSGRSPGGNRP